LVETSITPQSFFLLPEFYVTEKKELPESLLRRKSSVY